MQKLASRKESESREVREDLRDLMVLRTPVAQKYNLEEDAALPPKNGPPPVPRKARKGAAAGHVPSLASPPGPFPSSRVGITTAGGMGRSSIVFLVAIAVAVLTMSAIALAVVVPSSEWAFLGG